MAEAYHNPLVLPDNLPVPQDDGAARHLAGRRLPKLALQATDGSTVDLSGLPGRTVVYVYPRTGRPGAPAPDGWDAIPGARGCTPQSCGFRDHFAELQRLGVAQLYGLSTQDTDYQREAAERLHLPFAILSDADARTHARAQPADIHRRRHDAAQAHGLGDRRRRDHQGVLPSVSARQERRTRSLIGSNARSGRRRSQPSSAGGPPQTRRGTSPASARRCSCCSASSDSCRKQRQHADLRGCAPCANGRRERFAPSARTVASCAIRPSATMARRFGISAMVGARKCAAGVDLGRRRLVLRRHAAHRIGDAGSRPSQAVVRPRVVTRRARSRIRSASRRAGRRHSRR